MQLVMSYYQWLTQLLLGWMEPFIRGPIEWANRVFGWHVVFYPYWKEIFILLWLILVSAVTNLTRAAARDKGAFLASLSGFIVSVIVVLPVAFAFSIGFAFIAPDAHSYGSAIVFWIVRLGVSAALMFVIIVMGLAGLGKSATPAPVWTGNLRRRTRAGKYLTPVTNSDGIKVANSDATDDERFMATLSFVTLVPVFWSAFLYFFIWYWDAPITQLTEPNVQLGGILSTILLVICATILASAVASLEKYKDGNSYFHDLGRALGRNSS